MIRKLVLIFFMFFTFPKIYAQNAGNYRNSFHCQSFGLQGGLTLLENPFVLYPIINLSYSRTFLGEERHQLAVLPQVGAIILPDIETKFLISTSLQYKYISRKRFEASAFLGINYQLRKLDYDRYQFENNMLVNKGSLLHQVGPKVGINIGYKIIKKENYSVSPFIGISLTKLNKDYQSEAFTGYKPSVVFGININK
jgi:hypothetical protein